MRNRLSKISLEVHIIVGLVYWAGWGVVCAYAMPDFLYLFKLYYNTYIYIYNLSILRLVIIVYYFDIVYEKRHYTELFVSIGPCRYRVYQEFVIGLIKKIKR